MFNDFAEIIFKIILVIVLSSFIGVEREIRKKVAGLRTHILVGVGSTLVVLTSLYLFQEHRSITNPANVAIIDPTRMIAGIIQGIGFLCAGTIIRAGSHVSGLTSAATLWIVSCVGIAVGAGHYFAAIFVSIAVFVVLISVRRLEKKLGEKFGKHRSKEKRGGHVT